MFYCQAVQKEAMTPAANLCVPALHFLPTIDPDLQWGRLKLLTHRWSSWIPACKSEEQHGPFSRIGGQKRSGKNRGDLGRPPKPPEVDESTKVWFIDQDGGSEEDQLIRAVPGVDDLSFTVGVQDDVTISTIELTKVLRLNGDPAAALHPPDLKPQCFNVWGVTFTGKTSHTVYVLSSIRTNMCADAWKRLTTHGPLPEPKRTSEKVQM